MQDFLIRGDSYCLCRVNHPIDVRPLHFTILDGNNAVGIHRSDVVARDTNIDRVNLTARHQLRFFHRSLNGVNRRLNIDDNTFLQSFRRVRSDTNNIDGAIGIDFTNHSNNLGRPYIQSDDHSLFFICCHYRPPCSRATVVTAKLWSRRKTAAPRS